MIGLTKLQLENIAQLTQRLSELAESHEKITLENTKLSRRLREEECTRVMMLSEIAHELKKPLAVIRASLPQVESAATESEREHISASLDHEVTRAAETLDDLIQLNRIELHELSPATNLQLSELTQQVFQQFELRYPEHGWQAHIQPKLKLIASPESVYAILENLLENAGKYTPKGSQISLAVTSEAGQLKLQVSDNGPGIAATEQKQIFGQFFRGKAAAKTAGSGLGLPIVQRAAQSLGGELQLTSEKGSGSTFCVVLPTNSATRN
jgi:signal transduction histidine kinase